MKISDRCMEHPGPFVIMSETQKSALNKETRLKKELAACPVCSQRENEIITIWLEPRTETEAA